MADFWDDITHFTAAEFSCRHCGINKMDPNFIAILDELRETCGFPFVVTSGYRCPEYNATLSSTGLTGPHTTGRAVDLQVLGAQAFELVAEAGDAGITGIGLKQEGEHSKRFVHLDTLSASEDRPRPWVWTY